MMDDERYDIPDVRASLHGLVLAFLASDIPIHSLVPGWRIAFHFICDQ